VQGHSTPWTFRFWGTEGEMIIDLSSPELVIRKPGKPEKRVHAEGKAGDYIREMVSEIKGEKGKKILTTLDCLNSTRQTLLIQQAADLKKSRISV